MAFKKNVKEHEKLYEMEMMQTIEHGDFHITRVPGGWVFRSTQSHHNHGNLVSRSESMVFIPYMELQYAI
jgi:hypothetical protein